MCSSVTVPLDTVGVWTVEARSEQEPEPHLEQLPLTVTNKVTYMKIHPVYKHPERLSLLSLRTVYFSPVVPERPKTLCEHQRDSVQTTSPEGFPIAGSYVPQCDGEDGQYIRLQV